MLIIILGLMLLWWSASFVLFMLLTRKAKTLEEDELETRRKVSAALAVYEWLEQYPTKSHEENMALLDNLEYRP